MNHNGSTPEAVGAAPGPGNVFGGQLSFRENTPSALSVEALAADFVARRYRVPPVIARVVVELAGIGARLS